jgi:hypothetical protein
VDHDCPAPSEWWRSASIGLIAGSPFITSIVLFTDAVTDGGLFGAIGIFGYLGVPLVIVTAVLGLVVALRWRRRWWLAAAPPVAWAVLAVAAWTSGPSGSVPERIAGWALVTALMYGAAALVFDRERRRRVRVIALCVLVAAAPAMVAYDELSQYRWRRATFALAPHVLPVVAGYAVTGTGAEGRVLDVRMDGPADLRVLITHCDGCAVRREESTYMLIVVDGRYRIELRPDEGLDVRWTPPARVDVRAAGRDELARMSLAYRRPWD